MTTRPAGHPADQPCFEPGGRSRVATPVAGRYGSCGLGRHSAEQAGQPRQPGQLFPAPSARRQVLYYCGPVCSADRAENVHAQVNPYRGTVTGTVCGQPRCSRKPPEHKCSLSGLSLSYLDHVSGHHAVHLRRYMSAGPGTEPPDTEPIAVTDQPDLAVQEQVPATAAGPRTCHHGPITPARSLPAFSAARRTDAGLLLSEHRESYDPMNGTAGRYVIPK